MTGITPAELRQARRNQAFDFVSSAGQCPLKSMQVSIFPVRYALDESPAKGSAQGPNPLPGQWSGAPPALQTRSYTLRQLRDGWLYVRDRVDDTFHEYQVQGYQFIRHTWTDNELFRDVRHNPGESQPYLLYPRRSQLQMAWSPVQWTWRLCELMRSDAARQTRWTRTVDLPAYCARYALEHGAPLTRLGKSVADILVQGAPAPTFTTTLLPTQAVEGVSAPFKPAFEECLVRGRVPDQRTALFVALDDPLALIDDLSMNLSGRLQEQSQFERQQQAPLQSALAVQNLCGFDAEAFIPATLKDPAERLAYTDDLYSLLQAHDETARAMELTPDYDRGIGGLNLSLIESAQTSFTSRWGHLPEASKWQKALEEWHDKRLWREDVRFDDVQRYLRETTAQMLRLREHCQRSEHDLLTWLNRLDPTAESVFYDTCVQTQASQLMATAHALYSLLAGGEGGQQWLCRQASTPDTLFGLALFNFNPELAAMIKQVSHNFSTTGYLDDQGREGDGSTPAMALGTPGDTTSVATRTGELNAVLSLDSVQSSKAYLAMSDAARQAMATLRLIANDSARKAWHELGAFFMPAMTPQVAMTHAATQVLISVEISSHTQLFHDPAYAQRNRVWQQQIGALLKQITAQKQRLRYIGQAHERHAIRSAINRLEGELQLLHLNRPNQISIKMGEQSQLHVTGVEMAEVRGWLFDLGQSEAARRLRLKATHATEFTARSRAWMNQNLGSALPTLLVALNIWNFDSTVQKARNDGKWTADELRVMASNGAYAANAVMALWVGPMWNRAGKMEAMLGENVQGLAQAGYREWLSTANIAAKTGQSTDAALAAEFAAFSGKLILRTMTWAAFGAVAAGLEAWQVFEDIEKSTSQDERNMLTIKWIVLLGMGFVSAVQLIGSAAGLIFGFGWIMSGPVTVIVALLGVAYLLVSMAANRYKREGLRLWIYRCNWGRGAVTQWLGDDGHRQQMMSLFETLQRPTVLGKAIYNEWGDRPAQWQGYWLQILLPAAVAGEELYLHAAQLGRNVSEGDAHTSQTRLYQQLSEGQWIDPEQLGQIPDQPLATTHNNARSLPPDFIYGASDQHRLWQTWISDTLDNPVIELEIEYPADMLRRADGRGYMFRLAPQRSAKEADRTNSVSSGALEEQVVLSPPTNYWLKLAVPN